MLSTIPELCICLFSYGTNQLANSLVHFGYIIQIERFRQYQPHTHTHTPLMRSFPACTQMRTIGDGFVCARPYIVASRVFARGARERFWKICACTRACTLSCANGANCKRLSVCVCVCVCECVCCILGIGLSGAHVRAFVCVCVRVCVHSIEVNERALNTTICAPQNRPADTDSVTSAMRAAADADDRFGLAGLAFSCS